MQVNWTGIYPAVTTKFTEDDKLDLDTFGRNVEAQIEAGVSGIVLGGTLGEASSLTGEEKLQILQETKGISAGRVPVILNIAEQSTQGAKAFVKEAESHGADGFMLLPPMRYFADGRETLEYFGQVASSTALPIMIYNNPVDYKILVTIEMFGELSKYSNVQAVKESTRDVTNLVRMRNAFGDRFKILCGVDTLALEEILMGADGWVAGLVCAFPEETVAIFNLAKAGRTDEARDIYQWFMPLLELDIHPKLVQYIKLAEVATGLGTEKVRPPRLPLEGEERKRVQGIIDEAMAKRPALPEYKTA